jgi:hypothetical protein
MRYLPLLLAASVWPCPGTTPAPFYAECLLLDRVRDVAASAAPARSDAIQILELVALGKMDAGASELEARVGLGPGQLRGSAFKDSTVRSHAMRNLGKLDIPDALTFLTNLTQSDVSPDDSGMVWPSAQIALREAQLIRIPAGTARTRFLEDITTERTPAASWAVEELCEDGSYRSLGFVRQSIRRTNPTPRGEKEIAYCEARMAVLSRNPDPVKAVGSFLSVGSGVTDIELIGWAISKLQAMKSQKADAELDRYAKEIDDLPRDSALKRALLVMRMQIHGRIPYRPEGVKQIV